MDAVHIGQLDRRYRVPVPELARRLDTLTEVLLHEHLDEALARAGVSTSDELCIRHLHVELRYARGLSDEMRLRDWSERVAAAIRRELERGDDSRVIRYRSRTQALVDVARSLVDGRLERHWAWALLGIDTRSSRPTRADMASAWLAAVHRERDVAALVRALVSGGLFGGLTRRSPLSAVDFERIARTTLAQAGHVAPLDGDAENPRTMSAPDDAQAEIPTRHPASDRLVRHVRASPAFADIESWTPSLAVWPLVAMEPGLLSRSRPELQRILTDAVELLRDPDPSRDTRQPRGKVVDRGSTVASARAVPPSDAPVEAPSIGRSAERPFEQDAQLDGASRATDPNVTDAAVAASRTHPDRRPATSVKDPSEPPVPPGPANGAPVGDITGSSADDTAGVPLPMRLEPGHRDAPIGGERFADLDAATAAVWSDHAGLLMLLNAVSRFDYVDALYSAPATCGRPLGWSLERLATRLLTLPEDDPALAVFADRATDEPSWSAREPAPEEAERRVIDATATELEEVVRRMLPALPPKRALTFLCERRARLEITAGWIVATFALETVSSDIRRAGLDLHPDHVPWLGTVVRFDYA